MTYYSETFNPLLDAQLVEYQIDSWGIVEKGFRVNQNDPIYLNLRNEIFSKIPSSIDDFDIKHELISIHPPDCLTYLNETIVVVFNGPLPEWFYKKYLIPTHLNINLEQIAIKYDMTTGESYAKIYDLDVNKFWHPTMPEGTLMGVEHGVGLNLTQDDRADIGDFYFAHTDRQMLREFFGLLYPEYQEDFNPKYRGYCMSINQKTKQIEKVKRYIYVGNETLEDPYQI